VDLVSAFDPQSAAAFANYNLTLSSFFIRATNVVKTDELDAARIY
jgi:hypothetical protein